MKRKLLFLLVILCLSCLGIQAQENKKIVCVEGAGKTKFNFEKWVERDVAYIITENEKRVFLSLKTDEDRKILLKVSGDGAIQILKRK